LAVLPVAELTDLIAADAQSLAGIGRRLRIEN